MDINRYNLLSKGYKQFHSAFESNRYPEYYLGSFQKRFDDKIGKRYYITLHALKDLKPDRTIFAADCQFRIKKQKRDITFNAELHLNTNPDYPPVTQLEEMESFYEKLWNDMNCSYYEVFDEGEEDGSE